MACSLPCCRDPSRRRVDAHQRRSRLLGGPEPGSAGAARHVDQRVAFAEVEGVEHPTAFVEREEPDVREFRWELASVGVRPPDAVEGRTPSQGVVERVVAVEHGLEHAVLGHLVGQPPDRRSVRRLGRRGQSLISCHIYGASFVTAMTKGDQGF